MAPRKLNGNTPRIAEERRDAYSRAILKELERRKASGEPITHSAIVLNARYPDGTRLNRTTLYAVGPDGSKVHQTELQAIEAAQQDRVAARRRAPRKRAIADVMRELIESRALNVSLTNELHEAREAALEARRNVETKEKRADSLRREAYKLALALVTLTGTQNREIRHRIAVCEGDPAFASHAGELKRDALELAARLKTSMALRTSPGCDTIPQD